jgi:hypothetical protein
MIDRQEVMEFAREFGLAVQERVGHHHPQGAKQDPGPRQAGTVCLEYGALT